MNLIIQGAAIATPDLKHLAKLAGASAIEAIAPSAFRLCNATIHEEIAPFCEEARLDHAFVPQARKLADMRLAVMDMDSTLITIECIDEIADMQGLKQEVAAITAAAMRGELDYSQSLIERVALLKGLKAAALKRVYDERVRLSPGAEIMIARFRRLGIKTLLVSGGFTFFTERLRERLTERDAAILHRVMRVYFEIALAGELQVHRRVFGEQCEHMVEERNARADGRFTLAVHVEFDGYPRFLGGALDLGGAAFHSRHLTSCAQKNKAQTRGH